VISITVMVCELVEKLLQASVAVHVLVTLYDPAQAPLVVTSANVSVNALPQLSVAVATSNIGVAGQLIVVGPVKAEITGAVISITVMVCELVEKLLQASVAVHVLVTLYDPAQAPLVVTSANVSVNALPQLSVAVAISNTGVAGQLIVVGPVNAAITGAVIS